MMRRIDNRTVELSPREAKVHDRYEQLLDEGESITMATAIVRKENPWISYSFQEFLLGAHI